jgi:hypothetical protein
VLDRKRIANPTGATDPLSILVPYRYPVRKGRHWLKRNGALIVSYAIDQSFLGGH